MTETRSHLVEVELKARLPGPEAVSAVAAALGAFMEPAGTVDKSDEYWEFPSAFRFRIRAEGAEPKITFKEKAMRGMVEVNRETEFGLAGPEAIGAFRAFAQKSGALFLYRKSKKGSAWRRDGILAELVDVEPLGTFLELETIRDSEAESVIEEAIATLHAALARCGLGEEDLEPRPYSELLGVLKA